MKYKKSCGCIFEVDASYNWMDGVVEIDNVEIIQLCNSHSNNDELLGACKMAYKEMWNFDINSEEPYFADTIFVLKKVITNAEESE